MHRVLFKRLGCAVCCAAALLSAFLIPNRFALAAEDDPRASAAYVMYDNKNGLPTSEANAIVQSKDGFIWIGGYSGLIRYDGIDFMRFDSSYGITSVVSLYIDSKERLWVGTSDNGAVLHENGEFRFFGRGEGLESLFVHAITEDARGNIIFATTEGLFYADAELALHRIDDERTNCEYVCEVICDNEGVVYGTTLGGSIFSVKELKVERSYSGDEFDANCICPDPENKGYVYIGTHTSKVLYGNFNEGLANYQS